MEIFNFLSEIKIAWDITLPDIIIDSIILASIWQLFSHFDGKREEKHLDKKLNKLYERIEDLNTKENKKRNDHNE